MVTGQRQNSKKLPYVLKCSRKSRAVAISVSIQLKLFLYTGKDVWRDDQIKFLIEIRVRVSFWLGLGLGLG